MSMPFTIDVSTWPGASPYWSASTPIANLPVWRAASKTPRPVEPDAWIDDVHALLVLAERELLALAGIPKRLGRDAGVLRR